MTAKVFRIHFDADMVVPRVVDGKLAQLVFRDWVLKLGNEAGVNKFEVTESFPEHDFTLPTHYTYELFAQRFTK